VEVVRRILVPLDLAALGETKLPVALARRREPSDAMDRSPRPA
jgi:hypothetical protein